MLADIQTLLVCSPSCPMEQITVDLIHQLARHGFGKKGKQETKIFTGFCGFAVTFALVVKPAGRLTLTFDWRIKPCQKWFGLLKSVFPS